MLDLSGGKEYGLVAKFLNNRLEHPQFILENRALLLQIHLCAINYNGLIRMTES